MLTAVSVETAGSDAINGTSQESDNLINSTESHEELIEHNNNLVNNNTINSTITSDTNHMDSHIVLHENNDTIDQNIDNANHETIITECDNTSGMSQLLLIFLSFSLIYV
jgi:hypothetical protein